MFRLLPGLAADTAWMLPEEKLWAVNGKWPPLYHQLYCGCCRSYAVPCDGRSWNWYRHSAISLAQIVTTFWRVCLIAKASISFVTSVLLSDRVKQLGFHWNDFHEIWYLSTFLKCIKKTHNPCNQATYGNMAQDHYVLCSTKASQLSQSYARRIQSTLHLVSLK
jgi:hypothetical protein